MTGCMINEVTSRSFYDEIKITDLPIRTEVSIGIV
jgi:hypothetical protein